METLRSTRGPLFGFVVGILAASVLGSGVAVAARVDLVQVVNELLTVRVVNERTPFHAYIHESGSTTVMNPVPAGYHLVIDYINSRMGGNAGIPVEVSIATADPTATVRYYFVYDENGLIDSNPHIHAPAGTHVRITEGSVSDAFIALTGYLEPE